MEEMETDYSKFMNPLPLNAAALCVSGCGTVSQLVELKHLRPILPVFSSDNQVNVITLFITPFEVSR